MFIKAQKSIEYFEVFQKELIQISTNIFNRITTKEYRK